MLRADTTRTSFCSTAGCPMETGSMRSGGYTVSPETRVLIFTGDANRAMVDRVIAAGGAGLVLKTGMFDDLLDAIRRVAAGQDCFEVDLGH